MTNEQKIIRAKVGLLELAKQLGSVKALDAQEMGELINLKAKFGLSDPRMNEAKSGAVACGASDYISRVNAKVGERGRMQTAGGVGEGNDLALVQGTFDSAVRE